MKLRRLASALLLLCWCVEALGWSFNQPPSTPIPCYKGVGPAAVGSDGHLTYTVNINRDTPLITSNGEQYVCASYLALCNDTATDSSEMLDCMVPGLDINVLANLWRWRYTVLKASECNASADAAAAGTNPAGNVLQGRCPIGHLANCPAQHVKCCSTPYCNIPGKATHYCIGIPCETVYHTVPYNHTKSHINGRPSL
jgi:hypothetical protein